MSNQQSTAAEAIQKQSTGVKQFIIFGIVGVSNTLVDIVLFSLLLHISVYYLIANVLAYGAGMLNSYIWNSLITFRNKTEQRHLLNRNQIIRFIIWNTLMLACSSLLIYTMVELAAFGEIVSKIIATMLILVIQFVGNKRWVFKQ